MSADAPAQPIDVGRRSSRRDRTASSGSGTAIMAPGMARLLLLQGQGLLRNPEGRATSARVLSTVESLGFVQIDSINVLERAHHLTLHARVHGYRQDHLRVLLEKDRTLFEQWTHDASVIPVRWYPHWRLRFEPTGTRIRANRWWRERMGPRPGRTLREVLARIEHEGPLQSRDFEQPRRRPDVRPDRTGPNGSGQDGSGPQQLARGWWSWAPHKAALEYLWRTGALAIARREGFEKVYDLSSRVHPEHHLAAMPDRAAHVEWACLSALERLGAATPRELVAFWHAVTLVEARRWCLAASREGRIESVEIEGVDGAPRPAVALADWRQRLSECADPPGHLRLLSPFDPLIRDRDRTRRLFGFDYRFEAFTPAARRTHGYYVLPILEADRLIGRLSARHDRSAGSLLVEGLWWEPVVQPSRRRKALLGEALGRLASLVGAEAVRWQA